MRRFCSFLLAVCLTASVFFSLTGCQNSYSEKRSSQTDRQVIGEVGGHKVRFELFKAFYYQYKSLVDGGDDSVWSGENAAVYWDELKAKIEETITGIYATLDYAEKVGIPPYGKDVDEQVLSYIKANVEGKAFDGEVTQGYGSFDAYLQALEEMHITDSVNRLVYRQSVCRSLLVNSYGNGTVSTDETAVRVFFDSADCLHLSWVRVEKIPYPTEAQEAYIRKEAEDAHARLLLCDDYEDMKDVIVRYSPTTGQGDIENGIYLSLYTVGDNYKAVVEEANRLPEGGVGGIVETSDAFYIPIRLSKSIDALSDTECFYTVTELFVDYCIFREIERTAEDYSFTYRAAFDKYDAEFGRTVK